MEYLVFGIIFVGLFSIALSIFSSALKDYE